MVEYPFSLVEANSSRCVNSLTLSFKSVGHGCPLSFLLRGMRRREQPRRYSRVEEIFALWSNTYKETGKGLSYGACSAELTKLKQEIGWLREPDKFSLQNSLRNLRMLTIAFLKNKTMRPNLKVKRILYSLTKPTTPMEILQL